MIDAYEKCAERLMNASEEDRAWLLAQLSPEDRIRIVAMLRDMVDKPGESGTDSVSAVSVAGQQAETAEHEAFPALASTNCAAIEKLLDGEPDWLVALLVRDAHWPWVEGYLSAIEPVRLERIECWVRVSRDTIKPAVVEHLLKLTNEKLARPESASAVPTAFEDILARLRTKSSGSVYNKAQSVV